jgi:hypothetical protein
VREQAPAREGVSSGLDEIPDDFRPTDSMRRWAHATHPGLDLEFESDQFRRHFRSTGARRKSWPDAWQKWIADSHKRAAERAQRPSPARQDDNLAIVARFIERHGEE